MGTVSASLAAALVMAMLMIVTAPAAIYAKSERAKTLQHSAEPPTVSRIVV
jgi:hypothetical protein